MQILVISGFLGSGKTTFIRELIRRSKKPLTVLENEYGETDLDSRALSAGGAAGPEIVDFSEGCVCCSQKDSFENSLIAISAGLDPEYLVIEPSGVGRLGNILSSIRRIEWDRIRLLRPVVVIAPQTYFANMQEYREICENQLRHASRVVFSHLDHLPADELAPVIEDIRRINPSLTLLQTPYTGQPDAWFESLLEDAAEEKAADLPLKAESAALDQYTVKQASLRSPSDLLLLLEALIYGRLGRIPRAKGTIACGRDWFRFDVASGSYLLTGCEESEPLSQCVFIGNEINRSGIDAYLELPDRFEGWKSGSPLRKPGKTLDLFGKIK